MSTLNKKEGDEKPVFTDLHNNKKIRNLEQQIFLLKGLKDQYKQKIERLKDELIQSKQSTEIETHKEKEFSQVKMLSNDIIEHEHRKNLTISRRFYGLIALIGIITAVGFISYSYYENEVFIQTATNVLTNFKTEYLVQNLKGELITTWVAWNVPADRVLYVDIVNQAGVSQDKIDAIKDAILSKNTVQIDDSLLNIGPKGSTSTYYAGWQAALAQASKTSTQMNIPKQFEISESNSGTGDVTVILSSDTNPDGLSGLTKSISDQNQILRSTVTIFDAQSLSVDQIKALFRHEFGHVLGLAYSTDPNDLMHLTIQTQYAYISSCDILAIAHLYNDSQSSQVVCQ